MSRSDLADLFVATDTADVKTWVVEAHPRGQNARDFLTTQVNDAGKVVPVDGTLARIDVDDELTWWVDTVTPRFWRFHTWGSASSAKSWLRERVERTPQLDWTWLPSGQLRTAAGDDNGIIDTDFGGRLIPDVPKKRSVVLKADPTDSFTRAAMEYLSDRHSPVAQFMSVGRVSYIERETDGDVDSFVRMELSRDGRIMARGNDWNLHGRSITEVLRRYKRFIELVETRRIGLKWGGGADRGVSGSPITIRYPRANHMDHVLEGLFSCREPFRLWGTPREADGYWTVEATDLHVGQRISLDVADSWIRIYLRGDEVCGNTVVRLASNLEHHLDARIEFSDPVLQHAFAGHPPSERRLAG